MASIEQFTEPPLVNEPPRMRRLNRLPILIAVALVALFIAVIVYGLSSRGLALRNRDGIDHASNSPPASDFADRLKRGVGDGVIDVPVQQISTRPAPTPQPAAANPFKPSPAPPPAKLDVDRSDLEPDHIWRARLRRERDEQLIREQHRQRMARMQANDAAYDSPITIEVDRRLAGADVTDNPRQGANGHENLNRRSDALTDTLRAELARKPDPNGQDNKQSFFNQDLKELGYLPNNVIQPRSAYELKRGSVIPAILITGINSDLPGRITAQVSQNVFDSATGYHLLIPQGAKLFGRYDSKVTFGQKRVLVAWTDIVFPDGATLQIDGMAGTDAKGFGGFKDRVNNHFVRTFGSAALVAMIGAGIDMAVPEDRNGFDTTVSAESSARRSFSETFGRTVERSISRNIDVQPTLEIRPGYRFNVLVDQDLVFPNRR